MTQVNISIEDIPVTGQGITAKTIKFQGQLDESNVDEKAKIIYQLIEQYPQNLYLLFDFDELEYMNSKSIGYLTDWYGKISQGNGKIVIAKSRTNICDILQVVGLSQLIKCFTTMDEAKFELLRPLAQANAPQAQTPPAPTQAAPAAQAQTPPVQTLTASAPAAPAVTPTATDPANPAPQIKL